MAGPWPIRVRHTVDEEDRRALAAWRGEPGMATLAATRRFLERNGASSLDDLVRQYRDGDFDTDIEGVRNRERAEREAVKA